MYRAVGMVNELCKGLVVGTNVCIRNALLTIMSGLLLETRGAILPALDGVGMGKTEVLRTRKAIQEGAWSSKRMLKKLNKCAEEELNWQALRVGGYRVNAVDTTGI